MGREILLKEKEEFSRCCVRELTQKKKRFFSRMPLAIASLSRTSFWTVWNGPETSNEDPKLGGKSAAWHQNIRYIIRLPCSNILFDRKCTTNFTSLCWTRPCTQPLSQLTHYACRATVKIVGKIKPIEWFIWFSSHTRKLHWLLASEFCLIYRRKNAT